MTPYNRERGENVKAILVGVEYDHMYYDLHISMEELKDIKYDDLGSMMESLGRSVETL